MHQKLKNMRIDEDKEEFDLSDHNLITAEFEYRKTDKIERTPVKETRFYYSTNEKRLNDFGKAVIPKINGIKKRTIGTISQLMKEEADNKLRTEYRNPRDGTL